MPRKARRSSEQATFVRHDIPQMPKGYYTPYPNPNLSRFVQEHATPYDPETDTYDVPPFDQPITTTKATAIYNMHTYWSKKPHDAIRQYIRHYTQPGDIVLDPFCGSGGTGLAALMEGRKAIAIDLSPAATFITKNYCTPVDVAELQTVFEQLQAKVKPEMDWLYETRCDRCDGRAQTAYTVYSQVFRCERCLNAVPLFDCIEVEGQTAQGKPKTISACPFCYADGFTEEIRTGSIEKLGAIPVMVSYECQEGCKPKRDFRHHNDENEKKRDYFRRFDLAKLDEIERKRIPHWTPNIPMIKGYETTVKRDLEAQGVSLVDDLYTKRSLWALAAVRKHLSDICNPTEYSNAAPIWTAVTTVSLTGSRMLREEKRAILAGTYYIPAISREIRITNGIEYNVFQAEKGFLELADRLSSDWAICISTQSAVDLRQIETNTIDYIFTDPPYAHKVQYGELNYVWEAWLGFETNWHDGEIIVNEVRGKSEKDWARLLSNAMQECYRVLKPGRWLSLCYHDTSEGTWQLVQDLMTEVGFIPEQAETTLYIDAGQKSFNQLIAEKVTKRDLVINFRKPHLDETFAITLIDGDDERTFTEIAQAILRDALIAHPGISADRLYDALVSRMVRRGTFERHNFDALLRGVAEESEGRWYLLETADQIDDAETRKEEAAAAILEAFIIRTIKDNPGAVGVHFSDLFEQNVRIKDKPRRELRDWMRDFFYETGDGTWRPPRDEEERRDKAALRQSGLLRRVKRFANALIEGVPPSPRDVPENAASAADWLHQCRRAGLYEQGRAIYEKGGFMWSTLPEEAELDVLEDYQLCVRYGGGR